MFDPLKHIKLGEGRMYICNDVPQFIGKIHAQVVDMTDDVIVNAAIEAATEAGITDLYLLDKTFVVDALKRAAGGGRWIVHESPAHLPVILCSECGTMYQKRHKSYLQFCPNCGTRMDGEDHGES